jgi:hypothetical protein
MQANIHLYKFHIESNLYYLSNPPRIEDRMLEEDMDCIHWRCFLEWCHNSSLAHWDMELGKLKQECVLFLLHYIHQLLHHRKCLQKLVFRLYYRSSLHYSILVLHILRTPHRRLGTHTSNLLVFRIRHQGLQPKNPHRSSEKNYHLAML